MPALLQRRHLYVPTLWGWALLLGSLALIATACILGAYRFLAVTQPVATADGRGARLLVVEGWLEETELDQAVTAYRQGHYERVLTTGGPILSWRNGRAHYSYAERAADYLREHGLADAPPLALSAPVSRLERTYLSALVVHDWATRSGVPLDTVDVFTAGPHARRSRMTYQLALGRQAAVGVIAADPETYHGNRWWRSSAGAKVMLTEVISYAWASCCFWPPAPDAPARPGP